MLKVGVDLIEDKKKGKQRRLSYKDVEYDFDGWADASKYLPLDFDLVLLKTEKRNYKGWSVGNKWDSLRDLSKEQILYWKSYT